jgi:hypothetical protein
MAGPYGPTTLAFFMLNCGGVERPSRDMESLND